jgi:hypothetical protein
LQEIIFKKYVYRRQILLHLAEDYKHSIPWIRKQIFEYEPVKKTHNPRAVVIVCDATFYGKKKDKLGTLVFFYALAVQRYSIQRSSHMETCSK